MPQANINLPNSAGNIFRANNNAALAAIMSNNSGGSPPGSPDVGWIWVDTNTPTTTLWTVNMFTGASWLPIFLMDVTSGKVFPAQGIPIGATLEWNSDTLPAGFLWENGLAVSRSAYAALFAAIGTTWGNGDGSTTFNVPDSRNMFAVGKGNMGGAADRALITSAVAGFTPTVLAAFGGSQLARLPLHSHSVFDPSHLHGASGAGSVGNNLANGTDRAVGTGDGTNAGLFQSVVVAVNYAATGISLFNAGVSNASALPPTIVKNKIIFSGVFT